MFATGSSGPSTRASSSVRTACPCASGRSTGTRTRTASTTRARRLPKRNRQAPGEGESGSVPFVLMAPRTSVIFENPEWPNYADYGLYEVEAGKKLVAYRVQGSAEIPLAAYVGKPGDDGELAWTRLRASNEGVLGNFVTVHGNKALLRIGDRRTTNNFAIIAVDLADPSRSDVFVPEDPRKRSHPGAAGRVVSRASIHHARADERSSVRRSERQACLHVDAFTLPGAARSRHSAAMIDPARPASPTRASTRHGTRS